MITKKNFIFWFPELAGISQDEFYKCSSIVASIITYVGCLNDKDRKLREYYLTAHCYYLTKLEATTKGAPTYLEGSSAVGQVSSSNIIPEADSKGFTGWLNKSSYGQMYAQLSRVVKFAHGIQILS